MLVLSRNIGEGVRITNTLHPEEEITVYYTKKYAYGHQIKLGIEAPKHYRIIREELAYDTAIENAMMQDNPEQQ